MPRERAREASLVAILAARSQVEADLRALQSRARIGFRPGPRERARAPDPGPRRRSERPLAQLLGARDRRRSALPRHEARARFRSSWRREVRQLLSPLVNELKRATSRPREIDRLRTEIADLGGSIEDDRRSPRAARHPPRGDPGTRARRSPRERAKGLGRRRSAIEAALAGHSAEARPTCRREPLGRGVRAGGIPGVLQEPRPQSLARLPRDGGLLLRAAATARIPCSAAAIRRAGVDVRRARLQPRLHGLHRRRRDARLRDRALPVRRLGAPDPRAAADPRALLGLEAGDSALLVPGGPDPRHGCRARGTAGLAERATLAHGVDRLLLRARQSGARRRPRSGFRSRTSRACARGPTGKTSPGFRRARATSC